MTYRTILSALTLSLLLAACGGGGGGGSAPEVEQSAPEVEQSAPAVEQSAPADAAQSTPADATPAPQLTPPTPVVLAPQLAPVAVPTPMTQRTPQLQQLTPVAPTIATPQLAPVAVPTLLPNDIPALLEVKIETALAKIPASQPKDDATTAVHLFAEMRATGQPPRETYRQACAAIVATKVASLLAQGQDVDAHPETQTSYDACVARSNTLSDTEIQTAIGNFFKSAT